MRFERKSNKNVLYSDAQRQKRTKAEEFRWAGAEKEKRREEACDGGRAADNLFILDDY